jgi:Fur family transcriptional regulator, ferric uptake regulator
MISINIKLESRAPANRFAFAPRARHHGRDFSPRTDMTIASYIKRVRAGGHRVTPKVRAVLGLFLERGSVLDPFQVQQRLQRQFRGVGLPTVYRILETLAGCGILLTAANEDRQLRYFICRGIEGGHHHHFICLRCGKVEEVNVCLMEELEKYVKRHLKAKVQNHFLQIEGLCAKCG